MSLTSKNRLFSLQVVAYELLRHIEGSTLRREFFGRTETPTEILEQSFRSIGVDESMDHYNDQILRPVAESFVASIRDKSAYLCAELEIPQPFGIPMVCNAYRVSNPKIGLSVLIIECDDGTLLARMGIASA